MITKRNLLALLIIGLCALTSCKKEELKPQPIHVSSVSISSESLTLTEGDSQTLTATVSPSNADNQKVIWSSSDASIASVDGGKVSAIKAGTATITAKSDDGGKAASCKVTVKQKSIPVESISLDKTEVSMFIDDQITLVATISPSDATNKNVLWSSSDALVAKVEGGKVIAIKEGTTTITAKSEDGEKTATCAVTVSAKVISVDGISLDKESLELIEGDESTLIATITPENASNKKVSWTSSNPSVASVENGKITAIKEGTTTITAKSEDGEKTATCAVTVSAKTYPVTGVTLNKTSITITIGETETLEPKISPTNASNKSVNWSSDDPSIVSVDQTGKMTAKAVGTANVTVKTSDGDFTATCKVTVVPIPVSGVSVEPTILSLTEGDKSTLTATITPENATNKTVTWSSDNSDIATVNSSTGEVTAVKAGTATITVKSDDGGKTAFCWLVVSEKPGISLNKTSTSIVLGHLERLMVTITPTNATNNSVTWSSDNTNVVIVDNNGLVKAMSEGKANVMVTAFDGDKTAICTVSVIDAKPEAVDLGLSVKWASCNLGAINPEDYGDYYAWGATEPNYIGGIWFDPTSDDPFYIGGPMMDTDLWTIYGYSWHNCPLYVPISNKFLKYIPSEYSIIWGGSGSPDNKTVLEPEDDAAHFKLGGKWRMPTSEEFDELLNNCDSEWTIINGIKGRKLTSRKNGNSIFFPAAGYFEEDAHYGSRRYGYYWSSTVSQKEPVIARHWQLYDAMFDNHHEAFRYIGQSIRPVSDY